MVKRFSPRDRDSIAHPFSMRPEHANAVEDGDSAPSFSNDAFNPGTVWASPAASQRSQIGVGRRSGFTDSKELFLARCFHDLGLNRTIDHRISTVYEICRELETYPADEVWTIWTAAEDLVSEGAPLKARKAGFALLRAFASHSRTSTERQMLYTLITIPIVPTEASLQISALTDLTGNGRDLSPFEADIVDFLNSSLEKLSLAAANARERQHEENKAKYQHSREISSPGNFGRGTPTRSKDLLGEVRSLRDIFYLVGDIITYNPRAFHGAKLEILVERVTSIAKRTTSKKDLHGVIKILRAITMQGRIPEAALLPCMHMLCTIFAMSDISFEDELWETLRNMLQAPDQQLSIKILLQILANPSTDSETSQLIPMTCVVLSTLKRIAEDESLVHLLVSNLEQLVTGLCSVHMTLADLEADLLVTVNTLLSNDDIVRSLPLVGGWDSLIKDLDAIETARRARSTRRHQDRDGNAANRSSPFHEIILSKEGGNRKLSDSSLAGLRRMAERIAFSAPCYWSDLGQEIMILVTRILVNIAFYLPVVWENAAQMMWDQGLLKLNENWSSHLLMLFEEVLVDPTKPEGSRCCVLNLCSSLFKELRLDMDNKTIFERYIGDVFEKLAREEDLPASIVDCVAELAAFCGPDIGNDIFLSFLAVIEWGSELQPTDLVTSGQISEQAVDFLIKTFMRCLPESAIKTCHVYKVLLSVAAPKNPTNIRLKVMKLFTRLRCTSREAIELISFPDTQGLAAALCRTEATAFPIGSEQVASARSSMHEPFQPIRQSRSSAVDVTKVIRSRSATRSSNLRDEYLRPTPPLWMYDGPIKGLPEDPRKGPSQVVHSSSSSQTHPVVLDISPWLDVMIHVLDQGGDWELYSYILVHLPSQLSNRSLCARHVRQLQTLHNLLLDQLEKSSFHRPPQYSGMKMGDVALCLYHILTALMAYHEHFGRRELDNAVRTFLAGINKWERVGKCCIHALTLCCYEIPSIIDRYMSAIIQKMSQKTTQSDLAVDILEFLCGLARLPDACFTATTKIPEGHSSAGGDEGTFYKKVFGICIKYILSTREQRQKSADDAQSGVGVSLARQSGTSGLRTHTDLRGDLPEYVYTLAYHVIIFWFLSIDLSERAQHVGWLAKELAWKDSSGKETLEEQSQVILDMMHRTAYSNLGETEPAQSFINPNEKIIKKTWLMGMSIITVEILPNQNLGQYTKRQASGTTHALYHHNTAKLPEHHVQDQNNAAGLLAADQVDVYPNHMFLQLSSTIAPVPIPLQPVVLPDEDFTKRALSIFDRTDTVDGHKVGVIYIGEGQCHENEILANTSGTEAYDAFLAGLGTAVKLQGAKFNAQGLDKMSNTDGTHTYAWRDRVTEIVFHVATMMPTDLNNDPHCDDKKRHIGNDRVKIIYNNSGQDLDFEVVSSAFNNVDIVVCPEARQQDNRPGKRRKAQDAKKATPTATDLFGYYRVQTLCSPSFPQNSLAASPKSVSANALAAYVRQIALSASVCAQVWSEMQGQGKYVSTWLARLQQINRLRERYGNTQTSANVSYPMPTNARTYVDGNEWKGKVAIGGMAEEDLMSIGLDFTRWT